MKNYLVSLFLIIISISCISNRFCNTNDKYLKNDIDTTKEFNLKGKYCIANIKDTIIDNDNAVINFKVFDRINGKRIENGVVWFYSTDTTKMIFSQQISEKILKSGKYLIEVWDVGYNGCKTKKMELRKNTKTQINFYLGTTVEF